MMVERCTDQKKLRKYENTEVSLDDDQSDQMAEVVEIINDKSSDTLSKIFEEAESQGKGTEIKEIWANDLRADKKEFDKDQEKNSINLILITSKTKNRWSVVTSVSMVRAIIMFTHWQCLLEVLPHMKP